jgi:hypothetical protein
VCILRIVSTQTGYSDIDNFGLVLEDFVLIREPTQGPGDRRAYISLGRSFKIIDLWLSDPQLCFEAVKMLMKPARHNSGFSKGDCLRTQKSEVYSHVHSYESLSETPLLKWSRKISWLDREGVSQNRGSGNETVLQRTMERCHFSPFATVSPLPSLTLEELHVATSDSIQHAM